MASELKIVVAGPIGSGKTQIANILSSATKGFTNDIAPTVGVRILEFMQTLDINSLQQSIVIQLWDMSGDEKYSITWPVLAKDADGLLLIYNAFDKKQGHSLGRYSEELGKNLDPKQVMVVAHKFGTVPAEEKIQKPKLAKRLEEAKIVQANAKENFDAFVSKFDEFSAQIYQMKLRRIEEEEKRLLGEPVQKKAKKPAAAATENKEQGEAHDQDGK